ncbi:MAG: hypothetical protein KDK39_09130 [Leptospiraceae bacterium]|nr:hypothetical protein [Leptospiraceae bacterium]
MPENKFVKPFCRARQPLALDIKKIDFAKKETQINQQTKNSRDGKSEHFVRFFLLGTIIISVPNPKTVLWADIIRETTRQGCL